ncbi:MAG: response regulator [Candidatus Pristimantibacillus sp.]
MLKAVVFDDEYIVIEGLRTMIDWSNYGIELVGTASDGLSALACFRKIQPDIVFTDIRMPAMTGLQLIEIITEEKPDTYCVVFSGFNEFEYVKSAIRLGVIDYLEKPISIQSIEQALHKINQHAQAKQEQQLLKKQLQDSQQEMLKKLSLELLQGSMDGLSHWQQLFGTDKERLSSVTVIKYSGNFELPSQSDYYIIYTRNGDEYLAIVIHFVQPSPEFLDLVESQSKVIPMGIGGTYHSMERISQSYQEAKKAFVSVTNDPNKHESIERAKAYIEQNFMRDLSLNEVSDFVNMNATYLSVLFKEVMGESYIKFLTRYRMELAKKLLREGTKVNDVNEKVGYRTYRHFAEVFKKSTGQTPGQYKVGN